MDKQRFEICPVFTLIFGEIFQCAPPRRQK